MAPAKRQTRKHRKYRLNVLKNKKDNPTTQKLSTTMTSITPFISKALAKKKFWSPGSRTAGGSSGGCALGTMTDIIVGKSIKDNKLPLDRGEGGDYARRFFMTMRRNGFLLTGFHKDSVQKTVVYPELRLQAKIDAMATNRKSETYVIELKTTQQTLQQHIDSYKRPSVAEPTLLNGLENTLYNRHQLQCGFQTMCVQKSSSVNKIIYGMVVVVCRQVGVESAVMLYPVVNRVKMMNPKTYNYPHRSANLTSTLSSRAAPKTIQWPSTDAPVFKQLMSSVFQRGAHLIDTHGKYHSGANYKIFAMSEKRHKVCIIVNKASPGYKRSKMRRGQLELVRIIADMHQTVTKCSTIPCLLHLDANGKWHAETITKRAVVM